MRNGIWITVVILSLLGISYWLGPVPEDPVYANQLPQLPSSLTSLQQYVEQSEATQPVREDNQARIVWHDSVPTVTEYSVVYLHGFAGSYHDGYPLNVNVADSLQANVYLARWAGHGLKPLRSLEEFSPEGAWKSAQEALAIGQHIGRKVIILSTSTGGTLAIKLAATYPEAVHALINISPNIEDDQPGAFLLNSPWGHEIAYLVSLGSHRRIKHNQTKAAKYWDTIYPAEALINLQVLIESTMMPETFAEVSCPVLTLYYHKNFLQEDEHVEVSIYPEVHQQFASPDSVVELVALDTPGTHFIGSEIKSEDWKTAQRVILQFCREKLGIPRSPDDLGENSSY